MPEERLLRMSLIRVNGPELTKKLQSNLAKHKNDYALALEGWREECYAALEKASAEYQKNTPTSDLPSLYVYVPKPEDHAKDYELAIAKLTMNTDGFIDLDDAEFRRLVMDEWSWTEQFTTAVKNYAKVEVKKR